MNFKKKLLLLFCHLQDTIANVWFFEKGRIYTKKQMQRASYITGIDPNAPEICGLENLELN